MVVKKDEPLFGEAAGVPHSDYYQVISQFSPHDKIFSLYSNIEDLGLPFAI